MSRTKAEVRAYLESTIGQSIDANCGDYRGQCVSLIKGLMNFLGVPNPYAARGNAKDCGDTLLRQGIADNKTGWLNVVVNRDMGLIDGVRYGHIWLDLAGEANYEQNGRQALRTTKNTRPISQGQQIINLDKYITEENIVKPSVARVQEVFWKYIDSPPNADQVAYYPERDIRDLYGDVLGTTSPGEAEVRDAFKTLIPDVVDPGAVPYYTNKPKSLLYKNIAGHLAGSLAQANQKVTDANTIAAQKTEENKKLTAKIAEYEGKEQADKDTADTWLRRLGQFLAKYWIAK